MPRHTSSAPASAGVCAPERPFFPAATIRVLIVEPQTLLRRLLARALAGEADFEVVGEAPTGRQAISTVRALRPDVVVIELRHGAAAMEHLCAAHPGARVILLADVDELAPLGLALGASGSLSKNCSPEQLAAEIRRARCAPAADENVAPPVSPRRTQVDRLARRFRLTSRETDVLARALEPELTMRQMAQVLSEECGGRVSESAAKHALERVFTKLNIQPRTRAALLKFVLEARAGEGSGEHNVPHGSLAVSAA